jgi:hypothetical protein
MMRRNDFVAARRRSSTQKKPRSIDRLCLGPTASGPQGGSAMMPAPPPLLGNKRTHCAHFEICRFRHKADMPLAANNVRLQCGNRRVQVIFGISVHDHIIVGKEGRASFKRLKLI